MKIGCWSVGGRFGLVGGRTTQKFDHTVSFASTENQKRSQKEASWFSFFFWVKSSKYSAPLFLVDVPTAAAHRHAAQPV